MLRKRMMSKKMSSGKSLIETLERRQLLANVLVTSLADSGAGSLRQAISDATSGDTIDLRFLSGVIELDTEITFNKNLTLNGPGANVLTIDGQDASRFGNQTSSTVTVRDLLIKDGNSGTVMVMGMPMQQRGGAWNMPNANTHATFERVEFESNFGGDGGVINVANSNSSLTIRYSSFIDNDGGYGGAIWSNGTLSIAGSTFTQNEATSNGGAIAAGGPSASIADSTFASNTGAGQGGNVWLNATTSTIDRTIIWGGSLYLNSPGNNTNTNILEGVDPVFANFGTPEGSTTRMYDLASTSPAIDAGGASATTVDQRGYSKNGDRDIGAYEYDGVAGNFAPVFDNSVADPAGVNAPFSLTILATDADQDTMTFESVQLPDFLTLNQLSNGVATITGTPTRADVGTHYIYLVADDGTVETARRFSMTVDDSFAKIRGGVLQVNGTGINDTIRVWSLDDETVRVTRNGTIRNFDIADVDSIYIFGDVGDDEITVSRLRRDARILAGNGNDTVHSGNGADQLNGGDGNDQLFGHGGDDRIHGGAGADLINLGGGKNRAWGGSGNDTLIGNNSIDRLWGETGDDVFYGRRGIDIIDGGADDDTAHDADNDEVTNVETLV